MSGQIDQPKCSFCGKSQRQVRKLIAGPGVYICDEIIDEEQKQGEDVTV